MSDHIRSTLRLEKLYDVRSTMADRVTARIVNKSSVHSSLASSVVDLENSMRHDKVERLFRERKTISDLLSCHILHEADTRAAASSSAAVALMWSLRSDAVSKTLRYRLTVKELEYRGIVRHLRGNAYSFQFAAAQARLQRTLALRRTIDHLRALNILNDPLYLARRMLEFNRTCIEINNWLDTRPSPVDVKASGVLPATDSLATSRYNQTGAWLERRLGGRPSPVELERRNVLRNGTAKDLESNLIAIMLSKKIAQRPAPEVVARYRPATEVDPSLASASHDLARSFSSLRLKRSLSIQTPRDELARRNILAPGSGIGANLKALDMAMRTDRLRTLIKDVPSKDTLIQKNILLQDGYPNAFEAQAKSLEFSLTQRRLKKHIQARHSLSKLSSIDNEYVIISSCA